MYCIWKVFYFCFIHKQVTTWYVKDLRTIRFCDPLKNALGTCTRLGTCDFSRDFLSMYGLGSCMWIECSYCWVDIEIGKCCNITYL